MIDISVIIPTYNRKDGLERCLRSLARQSFPKNRFEIIVIDDGSRDPVAETLRSLQKDIGNLRFQAQTNQGPAAARNLGVRLALGEIVAFIDDDCEADPDWLAFMAQAHRDHPDLVAIGGDTFTAVLKASVEVGQYLSTLSIETHIDGRTEAIFFPTCNVSCKRSLFFQHQFDEDFPLPGGEDLEFFWRLFRNGYRFRWDRRMKVTHYRDLSLGSFARQAYIYGRGNLLTKYLHPDHVHLRELKTGSFSFWINTLLNFFKIPRFCYLLSRSMLQDHPTNELRRKAAIFGCFALHKVCYLWGNITEFLRIKAGKEKFIRRDVQVPRLLILDLTHVCNLDCKICDIWQTANAREDMPTSAVKKVLAEARELGVKEIALSGGEVLLRKDIFEIFEHTRKLGVKDLGVLSNGVVIPERFERMKPYLVDGTLSLVVSFDSLSPDLHNEIRNSPGAWQKTRECLQLLSALKRDHPRVNFNVITIVLDQNLEELRAITEYVRSLGANSLQFQALLPNNLNLAERKRSKFWVGEGRLPVLRQTLRDLVEIKKTLPDFIKNSTANLALIEKYYQGTLSFRDVGCSSAARTVLISNKGEYATCFSVYGDLHRDSLRDVLASGQRILAQGRVQKCSWPCLLPCFCDV